MYWLSEIIGKKVLCLSLLKEIGLVTKSYVDENTNKVSLIVKNEDGNLFFLEQKNIEKIGDVIFVLDEIFLTVLDKDMYENAYINKLCLNTSGKIVGNVKDILLSDKFKIQEILVGEKKYSIRKIVEVGENAVLLNEEEKKFSLAKIQNKVKIAKENTHKQNINVVGVKSISSINADKNDKEKIVLTNSNEVKYNLNYQALPNRVSTNNNFLLNRKLTQNILSGQNILVAKKGMRITPRILEECKKYFLLNDLIKYSE